ncbi:hypothetical protein IB244_05560 [Rhizobium sp. RHZ02]|uniref:aroma-sacti cluster domain-containing protein n=1 Tax=Rhizobium sp. RHZ02 TaxID=2769306 RepID=UPI001784B575|nr:aroma-sacti cluster domain-containing protein [Rhizobium sp. RHZ02]MBD9451039.1 hypothetical protein [Rhizobium sp. RHZ02]
MASANYDKLKQAKVFDDEQQMADEQKKQLEDLTSQEVKALIDIKAKLDKFEWPIKTVKKPTML